jgi:hypothetical protein
MWQYPRLKGESLLARHCESPSSTTIVNQILIGDVAICSLKNGITFITSLRIAFLNHIICRNVQGEVAICSLKNGITFITSLRIAFLNHIIYRNHQGDVQSHYTGVITSGLLKLFNSSW